jgi:hypothetical protein
MGLNIEREIEGILGAMSNIHKSLFASRTARKIGAGFHNIGSGVLRASDEKTVKKIELHYGVRCGHLPLSIGRRQVLVDTLSTDICTQMAYLSQLFGKNITPITFEDFRQEQKGLCEHCSLVVPYINVPETETRVHDEWGAEVWGLPAKMTHILKNKASFYQLVDEFGIAGFQSPDYKIAHVDEVAREAYTLLCMIEETYKKAGVAHVYPLGVMLRAAESDGNYGCCLLYEENESIILVPDGDAKHAQYFTRWDEALALAQKYLVATMNLQKETRVVISRYIDFADSPGMSVVIMDGQVESLGWNGQLQNEGSKACVGTSTYMPRGSHLQYLQQQYEDYTTSFFEKLLRKTAEKCGIDFAEIRGVANLDLMIPGELEKRLQQQRKQEQVNYLAECNPRWTNYTDAVMAVLGANRQEQTISNMRATIQNGICTFDKYALPEGIDPCIIREQVFEKDAALQSSGTRIICRMTKNPMGLIFAGDLKRAQHEFDTIATLLSTSTFSKFM